MIKEQSKHKEAPKVSFARDIKPLFRAVDISHMKVHGIKLEDTPSCRMRTMLTKCLGRFRRTKATRLPCRLAAPIGPRTSSRCLLSGRRTDTKRKRVSGQE
jgi:hypothetical protein